MTLKQLIQRLDQRLAEVNALRPLDLEQEQRIMQKLRAHPVMITLVEEIAEPILVWRGFHLDVQ